MSFLLRLMYYFSIVATHVALCFYNTNVIEKKRCVLLFFCTGLHYVNRWITEFEEKEKLTGES